MIDKWFRDDIEKVLETKNRVVIAAEDKNADFLYELIPSDLKIFKPDNETDELQTKYEIEKHFSNQKVVIFSESSRSKLNFLREYCETCGCIDIKFLHNYVKEKVHSQLKLNLQLTPDEAITAAKISRGKGKDYWIDIIHKGKARIIDVGHEILPFLNDPEQYCQEIDTQVKKEFFAGVNEWLGKENIEQPPVTLAREAAAKILGSLIRGNGEKKFKETYKKWADSKKYEASLDQYIAETPLTYDKNIWDVDVSHPFLAIDRKWVIDISKNLSDKQFVQKKIGIIKRRASDKTGKKVFETLWDDILSLFEFDVIKINKLNTFETTLEFYVDEFYKLDSAVRRLYARFLNEIDIIRPIQEYYNGILIQLLDKWHRYFKGYEETQSNILYDILEKAQGKCAIIVGDGITFEISKMISEKLQRRYTAMVSYRLAGFPSTTENNMSKMYVGTEKPEKVHKKREQALGKKCDSEINFLPLEKVNYSTDTGNHLICSYGDIDHIAETMQQNALKYISQMEDELAGKIDQLIKCGYKTVYLTSDHGFVLTGFLSESDKIEFDFTGENDKSERYVRTVQKQNISDPFVEVENTYEAFNYVYFHKSNRPFKTPGKYGYSHGGISPQELIVPFLCIEKKRSSFEKLNVLISNKEDLKEVVGENFEISLKTGAENDLFSMSRKVIILFLSEGKKVNQSDIITLQADEMSKKEYGFDNSTALEIVVVDAETKETLDKAIIKRTSTRDMGGLL